MKSKLFLLLAALLVFTTACGPSNLRATPTRHPLPAAPGFRELQILPPPTPQTSPQRISVTASMFLPEAPPASAIDGNTETIWNSGDGPEQWIQLDLGALKTVRAIRLLVSQYPQGESVHQIWVGADLNSLTMIHEFKGATNDSDILEFLPPVPLANVQFIKIVTTESPSWVAWREIEILFEVTP